jgi:hypothetical protein
MEAAQRGVEIFHLTFLGQLGSQLDKRIYAVKGGCNLRFFFDSPRMSEDLDLDVSEVAEGTLKNKVDRILSGRPLSLILRGMRMTIEAVSTPDLTERAVERASQVTFGEFKAQVVSYLAPREQALYDSETLFNDMVLRCLEALEKRA